MVPDLDDLTYEERLKEIQLTQLKQRTEKGDQIALNKLMSLEKTDRKHLIMKRQREARYLRGLQEKLQKDVCLNHTEMYSN